MREVRLLRTAEEGTPPASAFSSCTLPFPQWRRVAIARGFCAIPSGPISPTSAKLVREQEHQQRMTCLTKLPRDTSSA